MQGSHHVTWNVLPLSGSRHTDAFFTTLSHVGGNPGNGEKMTSVTQPQTNHYYDYSVPATEPAAEQRDSVEIPPVAPWGRAGWLLGLSVLPKTDPNGEGSLGFMSIQEEPVFGLPLQTTASSFPRTLLEGAGPIRTK